MYICVLVLVHQIKAQRSHFKEEISHPYNGLMLHGKSATEKTNCEAEGDNLSLSFSWYETAVHTKDLKPCGQLFKGKSSSPKPTDKIAREH